MSHDPPFSIRAPSRPRGSGRRRRVFRRLPAILAVGLLAIATGCGRTTPDTARSGSAAPASAVPALPPGMDGLLVASSGPLRIIDAGGGLVPFQPATNDVSGVTASAGVIVTIDGSGQATLLDASARAPAWTALDLPTDPRAIVRLVAFAPSSSELAIVAGDPQGASFVLTILDVRTGASRAIPVARGLNGPPSWLGLETIAVDVIRDAGHSGIATIELRAGVVTDRPGAGSTVVSSADRARLAIDDPATGDVLLGDVATWQAGAQGEMARIHGPPATGIEGLAMSADGTRLAIVRRSDAGGSIEALVRLDGDWRSVLTRAIPGEAPVSVAWLE
jgi:hypothetical protein